LVTSSADLTPSNNTKVAATPEITPENFSGRYIHWGIREHGMAAACNGIAVHGGFLPLLHRLLPAFASDRGLDEDQGRARFHPRFDRARRGRTDPPAGRALGRPPCDAQPLPLAPGRQRRDGRVLAGGARKAAPALHSRSNPPELARAASDACRREPLQERRLR